MNILTIEDSEELRQARTDAVLAKFRGSANEWGILHGLMCLSHPWEVCSEEAAVVRALFDSVRLASRLDEINRMFHQKVEGL